jgi:hypothetical protein
MNKERKLVTIRQIASLTPIEGADRIELALVDGWKVVVEKGLHNTGDYVCYFEIDSWIPHGLAPFLSKGKEPKEYEGIKGERLRTVRLRKQISQGLILPLNIVFDRYFDSILSSYLETNKDSFLSSYLRSKEDSLFTTELALSRFDIAPALGVVKYEPPLPASLTAVAKGNFPSWIRKTNQERVQNLWNELKEKYNDIDWEVSIKLDGTSATYYHNNGDFGVCSRNLELLPDKNNVYWKMATKYLIEEKLRKYGKNIAVQAELMESGELYVFDVWNIDEHRYCTRDERQLIMETFVELPQVPLHSLTTLSSFNSLENLLLLADGEDSLGKRREGLVFKSLVRVNGDVISFKVISNQYLLDEKA